MIDVPTSPPHFNAGLPLAPGVVSAIGDFLTANALAAR
jgi:hypothetical protein